MKFMAMCSSGLGSSFLVEMNIKKALDTIGFSDYEVTHSDLGGASTNDADLFIVGRDLEDAAPASNRASSWTASSTRTSSRRSCAITCPPTD